MTGSSEIITVSEGSVVVEGDVGSSIIIGDRGSPPPPSPPPPPPPDELLSPGQLPIGSRLPFTRNTLFTGRTEQLKNLAQALLHDQAPAALITQVTQGRGGVGKTQLAVEFAYRYGRYFHGVHWVNAAQPDRLDEEAAACGQEMALPDWPQRQSAQVDRTLWEWKRSGLRLVILDNLENVDAARQYLTRLSGAQLHVLITTRWTDWPPDMGLTILPLDLFTPGESLDFLRQHLSADRAADAELKTLAKHLDHLPLALELAGRCLARSSRTVTAYLDELKELETALKHPSMQGWRQDLGDPTQRDLNLITTFAVSWNQAKCWKNGQASCSLFVIAGQCTPNIPIPRELVQRAARNVGISEEICGKALAILTGLSLLQEGKHKSIIILPLLAEYAQLMARKGNFLLVALAKALAELTYQANETGLPVRFAPLRPHVEPVANAAEKAGREEAGTLWNNLGYHHWMVADYAKAQTAFKQAIGAISSKLAAIRINNLGNVLQDLGDLTKALDAYEWALTIFERTVGPNHPYIATLINNLGTMLYKLGDLDGALEAFLQALAIDERAYGPDHPKVATDISNLGGVLRDLGNPIEALTAYERALRIDAKAYGPDHPNVARDISNFGGVMYTLGNLPKAKEAYEWALAIDERVYGPGHPVVTRDMESLGKVLESLESEQDEDYLLASRGN